VLILVVVANTKVRRGDFLFRSDKALGRVDKGFMVSEMRHE